MQVPNSQPTPTNPPLPNQRMPIYPPTASYGGGYMPMTPNIPVSSSNSTISLDYYGQPSNYQGMPPRPVANQPYYGDPMGQRPYHPQYNGQANGQYPSDQVYGVNNQMSNLNINRNPPNYDNPNYHYYLNNGQNK